MKQIAETINCWAANLGTDRRTLERQLTKSGYVLKPAKKAGQAGGEKISAKAIDTARVGEITEAAIRLKNAQAEKEEMANSVTKGEMIPLALVLEWQSKVLAPISQWMKAFPANAAHLVNPTDPKHGQDQLELLIAAGLSMLRTEIGKVK